MKKLLLFAVLLLALPQFNAQMAMVPSKSVTKAIKKNPAILNAINSNPQLLNTLNLNEDLLEAVVDNPQILTAITNNPALINTINASPDFLKVLTKKEELLMAISMNPNVVNVLNNNPEMIKSVAKKPALINTIIMSNPAAVAATNNTGQAQSVAISMPIEEKKSTGSRLLKGALTVATGYPVGGGKGKLFERKILSSTDIQNSITKSKNKNVFLAKRYDEYIGEHKIVAVLPFSVEIEGENKKQITSKKERVRNEKEIEEQIQESLYKFLLTNQNKYSIEFQDINTTNLKLKNSGIMSTLTTTPKEEIAKALGVDAVIAGNYDQKMKNKDSKSGIIKITLYDGPTGDWVWKLDENAGSKYSLIDETDKLMNSLMEKVVNFFPYRSSK